MLKLDATILIPLRIKRKPLIKPVYFFVFLLLAFIFIPGIFSLFVKDEREFSIVILITYLIMLPIIIISGVVVCATALNKKNSVFRFIPDAPDEAVFKMGVLFDFESAPGKILYCAVAPEVLEKSKPMLTLVEPDKMKKSAEGFYKVSNLVVNHEYRLAMFFTSSVGIGLGGRYGFTGTGQFYWYVFIDEEYEKLISAIKEHNINISTSKQNDLEAKFIVDGIRTRNNLMK